MLVKKNQNFAKKKKIKELLKREKRVQKDINIWKEMLRWKMGLMNRKEKREKRKEKRKKDEGRKKKEKKRIMKENF